VSGDSDGSALPSREHPLVLVAPPEGIVRDVVFRGSQRGPPVTRLAAGAREIWVNFTFTTMPQRTDCRTKRVRAGIRIVRGKRIVRWKKVRVCTAKVTVSWYPPGGARPITVDKTDTKLVASVYSVDPALPRGVWRAVLRVGGRTVKQAVLEVA
jgi:hypothetical protein